MSSAAHTASTAASVGRSTSPFRRLDLPSRSVYEAGNGGPGGALTAEPGGPGGDNNMRYGKGGGGAAGVGWIRINTLGGAFLVRDSGSIVSPDTTTGCATTGSLVLE